jgi:hypothetical protein
VLLVLAGGVLVYQSRWLKLRIQYSLKVTGSKFFSDTGYSGFLDDTSETPLTGVERALTAVSWVADDLFVLGVVASLYRYLLNVPTLPFVVANPAIRSSVVFAGMLLAVVGAYHLIEALRGRVERMALTQRVVRAAAAAMLSGGAFALVIGVGLHSDRAQVEIGACFGAALALGVVLRTFGVLGHPDRPLPARVQAALRRTLLPPLATLGKLLDRPLRIAFWVGVAPLVGAAAVLRVLVLAVWYALAPLIAPLLRLFGHDWTWGEVTRQLHVGLRKFQHNVYRRVRGALLLGLLKGDGWLPRMIKREPAEIQPVQKPGYFPLGYNYILTDPLEPEAHPLVLIGGPGPFVTGPFAEDPGRHQAELEMERVRWRLLDLMLATFVVVYLVDVVVGHAITFVGRPLLHLGVGFAVGYGLVAGVVYMLLSTLGRMSLGGLAVGLVSGLSLAPTVGLAGSLALRLGRDAVPLLLTFLLALVTSTLGRRGLVVAGVLALFAGVYLMQA